MRPHEKRLFMKRIIYGFSVLVALMVVMACGNKSTGDPASPGGLSNQTPVIDDYEISNLNQITGNVTPVIITPKAGKSPGDITIYYDADETLPQTEREYAVTFDVAAATGWNAAPGLNAGDLVVDALVPDYAWYGNGLASIFYISNAAELVGFANIVNGTTEGGPTRSGFNGKTINLDGDIDLSCIEN